MLDVRLLLGDEVFDHEVEAEEFLDGEQVVEVLKWGHEYIVQLFFSLENRLF
jgi:hypothetical protein